MTEQPLQLILEEAGKVKAFGFDAERITIGRTADNAVKISDALSSRHHCEIRLDGSSYVVADLKSRNGTRLNGVALTEPKVLSPGDRIEVGDSVIHFRERADASRSRSRSKRRKKPSVPARHGEDNRLKVIQGDAKGRAFQLTALPFVCGRKASCSLPLTDNDVSNEHCMIVEDQGSLHLVDLGSTNGTFLDGVRIKGRAPLREGSQIRLGATLTLQLSSGATAASKRTRQRSARADRASKRAKQPAAVEEVESLEALEDEDATAAAETSSPKAGAPPTPPKARGASKRSRRPASADMASASALVEQEGDVTNVAFGSGIGLESVRLEGGGGRAGVLAVVTALLLVVGSVGYATWKTFLVHEEGDPSPAENKLADWSFEEPFKRSFDGPSRIWAVKADKGKANPITEGVRYGKRALALTVSPGTRPEFQTSSMTRVEAGKSYRVRAAVSLDRGAAAALRLDWRSDDGDFELSTFAVVSEPSDAGAGWRDLSGVVKAPRQATQVRVAGVALTSSNAATVRFDRVSFSEAEEGHGDIDLPGPGGLQLVLTPRGLVQINREETQLVRALAEEVGLVLNPDDPISTQASARLDQPLSLQADESYLALGAIPSLDDRAPPEYTFIAKSSSGGLSLRWQLEAGAGPIPIRFRVPSLGSLAPLELDGQDVGAKALPKEGRVFNGVREMSWGRGPRQVSFQISGPARVTLRPWPGNAAGEVELVFAVEPKTLANGLREAGFAIQAASLRTRETVRRLLSEGEAALRAGDLATAAAAYERLQREFAYEEAAQERSRKGLAAIDERADRLVEVARWARVEAETLPVPPFLDAARSATSELERGFPGSPQLNKAKRELLLVERAVADAQARVDAKRLSKLLARARGCRTNGHVRLARVLYTHIVEHYAAEVQGVREAKRRLAALPKEDDR